MEQHLEIHQRDNAGIHHITTTMDSGTTTLTHNEANSNHDISHNNSNNFAIHQGENPRNNQHLETEKKPNTNPEQAQHGRLLRQSFYGRDASNKPFNEHSNKSKEH